MLRKLSLALGVFAVVGVLALYFLGQRESLCPDCDAEIKADVLVYGSSLGGTTAAITLAQQGVNTVLASESDHVGGQAVDGGLSAFDDTSSYWENNALYGELKDYLRAKYGTKDTAPVGLGIAGVGSIASIPADIEEFFRKRMNDLSKSLHAYLGYRVISLQKIGKEFSGAVLQNNQDGKKILFRFKYLVDGTQTGKLYPMAKVPYSFGYDEREVTGEQHAPSKAVRDVLINGVMDGEKKIGGWGNLAQSVGLTFPIFDKGYRGDFFPPADTDDCWEASSVPNFVKHASVWQARREHCSADFVLKESFTDSYDIRLINENPEPVIVEMEIRLRGHAPMTIRRTVTPEERFPLMATLPFEAESPVSLTVRSFQEAFSLEGFLVSRTNARIPSISFVPPSRGEKKLSLDVEFPEVTADVYLLTENKRAVSLSFAVNGETIDAPGVGNNTYLARGIVLKREGTLNVPSALGPFIKEIIVVPSGPHFAVLPAKQAPLKSEKSNAAEKPGYLKEWTMTVDRNGSYTLFVSQPAELRGQESMLNLTDSHGAVPLSLTFRTSSWTSEFGAPIATVSLSKGKYHLKISSGFVETTGATLVRTDAEQDMFYGKNGCAFSGGSRPRTYDLWVKSGSQGDVVVKSTVVGGGIPFALRNDQGQYTYAGKHMIGGGMQLKCDQAEEVLAIPNLSVETYERTFDTSKNQDLSFGVLPPGRYRIALRSSSALPTTGFSLKEGTKGEPVPFSFQDAGGILLSSQSFVARGSSSSLRLPPGLTGSAYLFEDVPKYASVFFKAETVLLSLNRTRWAPLFIYRNMVTSGNLFAREFDDPTISAVARNTLGMVVVQSFSNDYAPVTEEAIDTPEFTEKARERSYAYYYWLRYEAGKRFDVLGCDPDKDPHCDTRRLLIASNVLGTPDGFARDPYIREARRLKTMQPIREESFPIEWITCTSEECSPDTCLIYQPDKRVCMKKGQKPVFASDAVAPAWYGMDFHTFLPREDVPEIDAFRQFVKKGTLPKGEGILFEIKKSPAPMEITLGSLIPVDSGNLFPASTNFGVTQIMNSALRIHYIEMAVGWSVGDLLAYSLENGISPQDLYANADRTKEYQRSLIERGRVIFPVQDVPARTQLSQAVQWLILEGILSPQAQARDDTAIVYNVTPDDPTAAEDLPLLELLFGKPFPEPTYRDVLRLFARKTSSDSELLEKGLSLDVVSLAVQKGNEGETLSSPLRKSDLYKALYLRMRD